MWDENEINAPERATAFPHFTVTKGLCSSALLEVDSVYEKKSVKDVGWKKGLD